MDTGLLKKKFLALKRIVELDLDYREGLRKIKELEAESPSSFTLWLYKGLCLYHLESFPEARACFLHALRFNESHKLWFYLGKTHFYLESYEEARRALRRSYITGGEPASLLEIGRIFQLEGKLVEAVKAIEEYVIAETGDVTAWEFLELLHRKLGTEGSFLDFRVKAADHFMQLLLEGRKQYHAFPERRFPEIGGPELLGRFLSAGKLLLGVDPSALANDNFFVGRQLNAPELSLILARLLATIELRGEVPVTVCAASRPDYPLAQLVAGLLDVPAALMNAAALSKGPALMVQRRGTDFLSFSRVMEASGEHVAPSDVGRTKSFVLSLEWHRQQMVLAPEYLPDFSGVVGADNHIDTELDLMNPSYRRLLITGARKQLAVQRHKITRLFA